MTKEEYNEFKAWLKTEERWIVLTIRRLSKRERLLKRHNKELEQQLAIGEIYAMRRALRLAQEAIKRLPKFRARR